MVLGGVFFAYMSTEISNANCKAVPEVQKPLPALYIKLTSLFRSVRCTSQSSRKHKAWPYAFLACSGVGAVPSIMGDRALSYTFTSPDTLAKDLSFIDELCRLLPKVLHRGIGHRS